MWGGRLAWAMLARLRRLPPVRRLWEVTQRTEQTVKRSHAAAAKAERLIREYRRMDEAGQR